MNNLLKRLKFFVGSATHTRTLTILALLIVIAAVPLTVFIAQQQQEVRQRASGTSCQSDNDCASNLTCVGSYNNTDTYCVPRNEGSKGAYCGTPDRKPNNLACQSYCNSDLTCGCATDNDCSPNQTCVGISENKGSICIAKNVGAVGSYCGTAEKEPKPNHNACGSGYCNPLNLTCIPKITSDGDGKGGCCDDNANNIKGCNTGETCNTSNGACFSGLSCSVGNSNTCNATTCPGGTCQNGTCVPNTGGCTPCSQENTVCSGTTYTSTCDHTTQCKGKKDCGGQITCSGGHHPGEGYPICEGYDEVTYTCGTDGQYHRAVAKPNSITCGYTAGSQNDTKISDGCPPEECDPNLKRNVCIETWKKPDGSTFTKPGTLTTRPCGDGVPPVNIPSGTISADPTNCIVSNSSLCTSTIQWHTSNASSAVICVDSGNGEQVFTSGTNGTQAANWIQLNNNSVFKLKTPYTSGTCNGTQLASVTVRGISSTSPTSSPTPTVTGTITPTPTLNPTITTTLTPTSTPGATKLAFDFILSFIGGTRGNNNPVSKEKNLAVCIYKTDVNPTGDDNCNKGTKKDGKINYDQTSGDYKNSNFDIGTFATDKYQVFVKTNKYLRKRIPTIVDITSGQTNAISLATLNVGDINNDNIINIADYEAYRSCYGNKTPNTDICKNADLNDDGKNDITTDASDLRILFEAFKNQKGD